VPFLLLPLAAILIPLVIVLTLPFSIVQRYRAGTARREARGWVAAVNVFALLLSVGFFLLSASISTVWIPGTLLFSIFGLASGVLLGFLGLALTRWEANEPSLHYTPNRWLVLALTLAVAARIAFGFWRAWHAWQSTPEGQSWIAASGLAGSMGAGALVLGYYLCFWMGVWVQFRRYKSPRFA
jgi:hypothetical protein